MVAGKGSKREGIAAKWSRLKAGVKLCELRERTEEIRFNRARWKKKIEMAAPFIRGAMTERESIIPVQKEISKLPT